MLIAVQADPINLLKPVSDTTLLITFELQKRGNKLFFYTPDNLSLNNGVVKARGNHITLRDHPTDFYKKHAKKTINLSTADIVFVRQDPPFNMNYITSTYFLDLLPDSTKVLNNPSVIRNNPEKLIVNHFAKYTLPTLVSKDKSEFEVFVKKHKQVIVKPLYDYGGHDVELIDSPIKFKKLMPQYLSKNEFFIMQKFVPSVRKDGDKRVIFCNGKILCTLGRMAAKGKVVTNLAAGGKAIQSTLTTSEKKMCMDIAKKLKKMDIFLAGADIVGGELLEINITSPTGIKACNALDSKNYEKLVANEMEKITYQK